MFNPLFKELKVMRRNLGTGSIFNDAFSCSGNPTPAKAFSQFLGLNVLMGWLASAVSGLTLGSSPVKDAIPIIITSALMCAMLTMPIDKETGNNRKKFFMCSIVSAGVAFALNYGFHALDMPNRMLLPLPYFSPALAMGIATCSVWMVAALIPSANLNNMSHEPFACHSR